LGTRPRLALALLLYTAQRRSDVVRMGRQHLRGNRVEVRQAKTGATLLIPMHPELRRAIDAVPMDQLTFLMTEAGKPFTVNGCYMRFVEWAAAAKLPKGCSPHGLRKAAARRLAEAGCTAHQIAAITGHRTLAEVARYTRAADQIRMADAAILRIGGGDEA
jgi:integrase